MAELDAKRQAMQLAEQKKKQEEQRLAAQKKLEAEAAAKAAAQPGPDSNAARSTREAAEQDRRHRR